MNLGTESLGQRVRLQRGLGLLWNYHVSKHGLCHPAETGQCQEVTGTHVPLSNGGEKTLGRGSEPGVP